MYSNKSGPLAGLAVVSTVAYIEKTIAQSWIVTMVFLDMGRLDNTSCCVSSPPSCTRIGCGSRAMARFAGRRAERSKYCRVRILDMIVCVSMPDSSPGRLNLAKEAEAPVGRVGGMGGAWDADGGKVDGWAEDGPAAAPPG